jgi:hypothetical protein
MGLEAMSDGQAGAFEFRRDTGSDVVAGVGQVVQALGTERTVAVPALVEPSLRATQGPADLRDRAATQTERDGSLTGAAIIVPGDLQSAAAGGCLWKSL